MNQCTVGATYSVCQNVALLCVDDEACGLARNSRVGVKGASLAKVYRNDALYDAFDGLLPLGRVLARDGHVRGRRGEVVNDHAVLAVHLVVNGIVLG